MRGYWLGSLLPRRPVQVPLEKCGTAHLPRARYLLTARCRRAGYKRILNWHGKFSLSLSLCPFDSLAYFSILLTTVRHYEHLIAFSNQKATQFLVVNIA